MCIQVLERINTQFSWPRSIVVTAPTQWSLLRETAGNVFLAESSKTETAIFFFFLNKTLLFFLAPPPPWKYFSKFLQGNILSLLG